MNDNIKIIASSVQTKNKKERARQQNEPIGNNRKPSDIVKKITEKHPDASEKVIQSQVKDDLKIIRDVFKVNFNTSFDSSNNNHVKNLTITPQSDKFQYTMDPIPFDVSIDKKKFMPDDFAPDVSKLKSYIKLLKDFKSGKKSIYMFDTETMGLNNAFIDSKMSEQGQSTLKDLFAITEASLLKVNSSGGNYSANVVDAFFSSPMYLKTKTDNGQMINKPINEVLDTIYNFKDTTGLMTVLLQRLQGYSGVNLNPGETPSVNNVIFNGNVILSDANAVEKGLKTIQKFTTRGTPEYFDSAARFIYSLNEIMENGDFIIANNSTVFDLPQLIGEMTAFSDKDNKYIIPEKIRQLQIQNGVSEDKLFSLERFKKNISSNHIDMLSMFRMLGVDITEQRVKRGYNGTYSFRADDMIREVEEFYASKSQGGLIKFNEKIANAAKDLGFADDIVKQIKTKGLSSMQHTGAIDGIAQVAFAEYFIDAFGDVAEEKIKNSQDKVKIYNPGITEDEMIQKITSKLNITDEELKQIDNILDIVSVLDSKKDISSLDDLYEHVKNIKSAERRLNNAENEKYINHLVKERIKEELNASIGVDDAIGHFNSLIKDVEDDQKALLKKAGIKIKENINVSEYKKELKDIIDKEKVKAKEERDKIFNTFKEDKKEIIKQGKESIKKEYTEKHKNIWDNFKNKLNSYTIDEKVVDKLEDKWFDVSHLKGKTLISAIDETKTKIRQAKEAKNVYVKNLNQLQDSLSKIKKDGVSIHLEELSNLKNTKKELLEKRNNILKEFGYKSGSEFFKDFANFKEGKEYSDRFDKIKRKNKDLYNTVHELNTKIKDVDSGIQNIQKNKLSKYNEVLNKIKETKNKIKEQNITIKSNQNISNGLYLEKSELINRLLDEANKSTDKLKYEKQVALNWYIDDIKNNLNDDINDKHNKMLDDLSHTKDKVNKLYDIKKEVYNLDKEKSVYIEGKKEYKKVLDEQFESKIKDFYTVDKNGVKVANRDKTITLVYDSITNFTKKEITDKMSSSEVEKINTSNKRNKEIAEYISSYSQDDLSEILDKKYIETIDENLFNPNTPLRRKASALLSYKAGWDNIEDFVKDDLLSQNVFIASESIPLGDDTFNFIINNGEIVTHSGAHTITKDAPYKINIMKASDITSNGENLIDILNINHAINESSVGKTPAIVRRDSYIVQLEQLSNSDDSKISYMIFDSSKSLRENFLNRGIFRDFVISTGQSLNEYLEQQGIDEASRIEAMVSSQNIETLSIDTIKDSIELLDGKVDDTHIPFSNKASIKSVFSKSKNNQFAIYNALEMYTNSSSSNNSNRGGMGVSNNPISFDSSIGRLFDNEKEAFMFFTDESIKGNVSAIQELFERSLLIPKGASEDELLEQLSKIMSSSISYDELMGVLFDIDNTNEKIQVKKKFELNNVYQIKGFNKREALTDMQKARMMKVTSNTLKYTKVTKKYIEPNKDVLRELIGSINSKYSVMQINAIHSGMSGNSRRELNKTKLTQYSRAIRRIKLDYLDTLSEFEIFDLLKESDEEFDKNLTKREIEFEALIKKRLRKEYGINNIKYADTTQYLSVIESLENEYGVTELDYKKNAFFDTYGVHYDSNSKNNIIIDKLTDTDIAPRNVKNVNRFSFKSFDGQSHKVIDLTNKEDVAKQIFKNINYQFYYKDTRQHDKAHIKADYVRSVGKDLLDRKLITEKDFDDLKIILKDNKIESAAQHISSSIFNERDRIINIINDNIKTEYSSLSTAERMVRYDEILQYTTSYKDVENFIDNLVEVEAANHKMYSINGVHLPEMVSAILGKQDGLTQDDIKNYVDRILSEEKVVDDDIIIIDKYSGNKDNQINTKKLVDTVGDNLGWNNEQKDIFKNTLDRYIFNKRVEINSYGDTINPSFMVFEQSGKTYLAVTRNNTALHEEISKRHDISKMRENHIVVQLPKVDDIDGIEFINQSKFSQKAVTKTIRPTLGSNGVVNFTVTDSVTDMLMELNNSMYYSVDKLVNMQPDGANYRSKKAWKNINEGKSLTGSSYQNILEFDQDGRIKIKTDYVMGYNISDAHKNNNIFYKGLMIEMGDVLDYVKQMSTEYISTPNGPELKDAHLHKLLDNFYTAINPNGTKSNEQELQKLKNLIEYIKLDTDQNQRGSKKDLTKSKKFDALFDNVQYRGFFLENISEMSEVILRMRSEDKSTSLSKEMTDILTELSKHGREAAIGVKPHEASKGYISLDKHKDAGIHTGTGNISRTEVHLQFDSSENVTLENILANTSKIDGLMFKEDLQDVHVGDILDRVGIVPGVSVYQGENYYNIVESGFDKVVSPNLKTRTKGFSDGFEAFTGKVKNVSPQEIQNIMNSIMSEKGDYAYVKQTVKDMMSKSFQLSDKEFDDYFFRSLGRISIAGSLYEDSRIGHVNILYFKKPTSVSTYRLKQMYNNINEEVSRAYKEGDKILTNTVLGVDKNDVEIRAKLTGEITQISRNSEGFYEIQILNKSANNALKLNIGGAERGIVTIPKIDGKNEYETEIFRKMIGHIQDEFFDGAIILANPDIIKHNANEIPVGARLLNIAHAITNDEEMVAVNEILQGAKTHNIRIKKSRHASDIHRRDMYTVTVDSVDPGTKVEIGYGIKDDIEMIESKIAQSDKLKNVHTSVQNAIAENKKGIYKANMSFASLTASNKSKIDMSDADTGASFTFRRLVNLTNIVADEEGLLDATRGAMYDFGNSEFENQIRYLYKSNKSGLREVQNIFYSLQQHISPSTIGHNIKVHSVNLEDIVADAKHIDETFSKLFDIDNAPNLIEVDISHVGIKNPLRVTKNHGIYDVLSENFGEMLDGSLEGEYITKIYIPNAKANRVNNTFTLSEIQKSAADVIKVLQDLSGAKDKSIRQLQDEASQKYIEYINAHVYELVNKEGKAKKLLKSKQMPLTGRALNQSIIAPVYTNKETKTIENPFIGPIIELNSDGKRIGYKVSVVHPDDFLEITGFKDFSKIGEAVATSRQSHDVKKQIGFINDILSKNNIDKRVSSIEEANMLFNEGVFSNSMLDDLGLHFMQKHGLESNNHRAPSIKAESDTYVFKRVYEGVGYGMSVEDPLSSKFQKKDSDGDNSDHNDFISISKDEDGNPYVRDFDDNLRVNARQGAIYTSEEVFDVVDDLVADVEKSSKLKSIGHTLDALDYSTGYQAIKASGQARMIDNDALYTQGISSILSKEIIGKSSNPAFYLRVAQNSLYEDLINQGRVLEAHSIENSISVGSNLVEQSYIDQKKINAAEAGDPKTLNQTIKKAVFSSFEKASMVQKVQDDIFDAVRTPGKEEVLVKKVADFLEMMQDHVAQGTLERQGDKLVAMHEGKKIGAEKMIWQDGVKPAHREEFEYKARQIINGDVQKPSNYRVVTIEGFFHDMIQVFKNDQAAENYTSMLTSTHNRNPHKIDGAKSLIYTVFETIRSYYNETSTGAGVASVITSGNLSDEVNVKIDEGIIQHELTKDKPLINVAVQGDNNFIRKGVYDIELSDFKGGVFSVNLTNKIDNSVNSIYGASVNEVNDILESLKLTQSLSSSDKEKFIIDYLTTSTRNSGGIKDINVLTANMLDDYWFEASSKAFGYNPNLQSSISGEFEVMRASIINKMGDIFKDIKIQDETAQNVSSFIQGLIDNNFIEDAIGSQNTEFITKLREDLNRSIIERSKQEGFSYKNTKRFISDFIFDTSNEDMSILQHTLNYSSVNEGSISFIDDMIRKGRESTDAKAFFKYLTGSNIDVNVKKNHINQIANILVHTMFDYNGISNEDEKADLINQHVKKIEDIIKKDHNINFDKTQQNAIRDIIKYSHDRNFIMEVSSLDNHKDIANLTVSWMKDYALTQIKHLDNDTLKELINKESDIDGINNDFVNEAKRQVIQFIQEREGLNEGTMAYDVNEYLNDLDASMHRSGIIDEINKEIVERGSSVAKDVGQTVESTLGGESRGVNKIFEHGKKVFSKHKTTIAAATLLGLGMATVMGYNIRNNKKALQSKEDESNKKNAKKRGAIPVSNKIYTNNDNNINVNIRARHPLQSAVTDGTSAIKQAIGNDVRLNTHYTDDRENISNVEVDEVIASTISDY